MKIRNRANLLITTIVLVMFLPLSSLMLHFAKRSLREVALDTVASTARNSAQLLAGVIESSHRIAEAVAASVAQDGLEQVSPSQGTQHLHRLAHSLNFRDGVLVLDRSGNVVQDPLFEGQMAGLSLSSLDFFTRTVATRVGVVSGPHRSLRSGKPILTFTAPILGRDGNLAGVVACNYELLGPGPFDTVRQQQLGRTGYVYVLDRSRMMVLHPDTGRMLNRDIPPGANALIERAFHGGNAAGETRNSMGIPMLAAYHPVSGVPWVVVAQLPQAEAYAALPGFRRLMLLATSASLILLLGIGMAATQYFTRPITLLHEAAQTFRDDPEGVNFKRTLACLEAVQTGPEEFATLAQTTQRLLISRQRNTALLRQAAAEWERTFDSVIEAILVMDAGGRILRINRTAADWFQVAGDAATGLEGRVLVLGRDAATPWPRPGELDHDHPSTWTGPLPGREGVFEFRAAPIFQGGSATGMILTVRDITEEARQADQIRRQALFDGLTGLPNRLMLTDRLNQALARRERTGGLVAVLFLDLDRFKEVNDTRGHEAGDAILLGAAQRMTGLVRRNDTLARLGGDEFVLVLTDVRQPDHAMQVAAKVIQALSEPFVISGESLRIGASVGVALAPEHGREGAELLQHADAAMYQAKRSGRSTCCLYAAGGGFPGPGT